MKIYKINGSNEKNGVIVIDQVHNSKELLDSMPLKGFWKPIKCVNAVIEKKTGDFSGVNPYFINKKAAEIMKPFLKDTVELLPVKYDEEEYYLIHFLKLLDALDREKSEIVYFDNGNRIMTVDKYEFRKEVIKSCHFFSLDSPLNGSIFVDDEFITTVEKYHLTGFSFKEVWSDNPEENVRIKKPEPKFNVYKFVQEVDHESMEAICDNRDFLIRQFECGEDGKSWAEAVYKNLEKYLQTKEIPAYCEDEIEYILMLGSLFGEALCKGYGWKWKNLGNSKKKMKANVVSPKNYFSCNPFIVVQNIAEGKNNGLDGRNDNTIALLYNMCEKLEDKPTSFFYCPIQ